MKERIALKIKENREFWNKYYREYYKKNIEKERKRCRDYYRKNRDKKRGVKNA